MMRSPAGSSGGAARGTDKAYSSAEGAPAGRACGASAGSSIPEGVSTGQPDIRQALLAARPGDDRALPRGEKQGPNDFEVENFYKWCLDLTEWHRDNPGKAPPIDPFVKYCLFPPGVDARLDLANPGHYLAGDCRSYKISNLRGGFDVRVKLGKRCFEIIDSPPPVEGCLNSVNRSGILTIGFGSATDKAWILVLKVLDQVWRNGQRPLALAANSVSRASAGTPEERHPRSHLSRLFRPVKVRVGSTINQPM